MGPSEHRVTVMRLEVAHRSVLLRLVTDPAGRVAGLARALGHALLHDGALPEGPVREAVLRLGQAFDALPAAPAAPAEAVEALRRCLGAGEAPATLTSLRTLPPGQAFPRWAHLWGDPPPATGPGIWPFDPEVAGLRLGTRRLVKRELAPGAEADGEAARLAGLGLSVRRVDRGEGVVLLAALDPAELDPAEAAERALGTPGEAAAIRHLGDALGYPPCCVDAFLALGARDDLSLAASALPPLGSPPAPPETQWLNWPLALVSHAACSPTCAPTLALGRRLLAALDADCPGFAARWRALARRVQVVDPAGRALALAVTEGPLDGAVITAAVGLDATRGAPAHDLLVPRPDLVGARLDQGPEGLRIDGPEPVTAVLVADHRGGDGDGARAGATARDGARAAAAGAADDRVRRVVTNETCNQNCAFCDARRPAEDPAFVAPGAVAARIAGAARGGGEVVLTGGEPTLRRDLVALVARARAAGAGRVVLETNGALVDPGRTRALAGAGLDLARIHLPALGAALDALTRDPGGAAATLAGARALADAGVALEAAAPLVADNAATLPDLPAALVATGLPFRALVLGLPRTTPDPTRRVAPDVAAPILAATVAAAREAGLPVRLTPAARRAAGGASEAGDLACDPPGRNPGSHPDPGSRRAPAPGRWQDRARARLLGHPETEIPLGALVPEGALPAIACTLPWSRLEVSTVRHVGPCCSDYQAAPVRAGSLDVAALWNGEVQRAFRRALAGPGHPATCRTTCPLLAGGRHPAEAFALRGGTEAFVAHQIEVAEDLLAGRDTVRGGPLELELPPTTFCNYDCLMCEWGVHGTLDDELQPGFYAGLSPLLPGLSRLEVAGGEPLASPAFRAFLETLDLAAYPDLRVGLVTNGSYLAPRLLERIARVPFSTITVSLNGATPETYARVNRGLPFERVRAHLDDVLARRRAGTLRGGITYSMVILEANRHEIRAFAALARADGVDVRFLLPMFDRNGQSILTRAASMEAARADLEAVADDLAARGDLHGARLARGEARVLAGRLEAGLLAPLPDGRAAPEAPWPPPGGPASGG